MYVLRKTQQEAVDTMEAFLNNPRKDKGVWVLPVGTGKSIIISELASKFPEKYFINVTSSKELVKQNYERFTNYNSGATICSASLGEREVGHITFATIGTLVSQLKFYKDKDTVIIQDECHIGSATDSQLATFIKKLSKVKLVGLTATPFRLFTTRLEGSELKMMNRDYSCLYKSIESVVQIRDVVEEKNWTPLIYEERKVDESQLKLNTTGVDFTDESIKTFVQENEILKKCIDEVNYLRSIGQRSILISVNSIEEALELEKLLPECRAVYSGMCPKERDEIVEGFKNMTIEVVVNLTILSIGFDHPQLQAVIMAKPTNSLTFYYQLLGRAVRKYPGKENAYIIDLCGNTKKFGKIEDIIIENHIATKGWAAFSQGKLLTGYPLNTLQRPTVESLLRQAVKIEQKVLMDEKFYFGKYNGKKVSEVFKKEKRYLTWLIDNPDFKWTGMRGINLKQSIKDQLGL